MLRPSNRKKDYKKGISEDEARRKREDNIIELRKTKRDENILKKRQTFLSQNAESHALEDSTSAFSTPSSQIEPSMIESVMGNDVKLQHEATQKFRKLLSMEKNPPIEEVIRCGVVPKFVEFLSRHDAPNLQFEAAWALTNVASGTSDHTKVVIDYGAIPIFVDLLSSPSDDVREQAVWALGNIAGDSYKCRDLVLSHNALPPLLSQMTPDTKIAMLRNATWTLSNFCRGKPVPDFAITSAALPTLARLIHSNDEEVLTDACWALSYLSDGDNERIETVIQSGVTRRLVELLMHTATGVLVPALRSVGNIVTGNDVQTQVVLNSGALVCLYSLLNNNHKKSIKKEACWTISNITAGTKEQIQAVIDAGLIPLVINFLATAEFEIKKEAAWAISNATSGGTAEHIQYLVDSGCIPPLCNLLSVNDQKIVTVALEGLENILKIGDVQKSMPGGTGQNMYAPLIEAAGGVDKLEDLQGHPDTNIYNKTVSILEVFFDACEEVENITPQAAQEGFVFGLNQS
mmetsp:Transcript_12468/g.22326  ORF Transcript_12468/g.22326 Transcript_12468/m.22326 type:complete len:518 (-) Transcript_12468:116-1669(-)|eukprot:CAMPEP_0175069130 /NCGR_PEP_ID=MMETSP0052_2-20121109/18035_1 /TAXON_ID=51329 ORGANISM="Polytomella parva, Strain SAG 63-3" /NCGR_SAMPLE_ID=MMETSP0052_2 /ASSEMBLY_ACC=CAM_ASM_000194 /LENGTH=517 /DNA_ID=CAMNT_0016336193 /DNA_START=119 /DNA_END=1672 /DNA_ORIENTATION=-